MIVPYSLLMIKPMSVGRGDAPAILASILDNCPVVIRKFREFAICDTTLIGLCRPRGTYDSNLDYGAEKVHPPRNMASWIMVLTHLDRVTDPTQLLEDYCGPLDRTKWKSEHLRHKFGGYPNVGVTAHPSDNVVHIAHPMRKDYEAMLLFMEFDEDKL